jgi:TonB-linked SusC/RagA family outer membrane protein
MKLYFQKGSRLCRSICKRLHVLLLTLAFVSTALAQKSSAAQLQKITLSKNNIEVKEVFASIQKQTHFKFLYTDEMLSSTNPVNIHVKQASIETVLQKCFIDVPLTYTIDDSTIVVKRTLKVHGPNNEVGANTSGKQKVAAITVTGKVSDIKGQPLPGVSLKLKGTSIGATTNADGNFSISVPDGNGTLVFSYVGFVTQEIALNGRTRLDVKLAEDSKTLNDVVVIGYGTQKRKDLTGSVASVSEKDFADMPVANISEALGGRIPGLDVMSSGGRPGDPSTVQLRGTRSFTASNDPLIILDGMPFYGSMNDINPYDISSIDVLKDASSTAIYGSRGSNGVIIITTKRGKTGKPKFMIESYAGPQIRYGDLPYANALQYADWGREAFRAQPGGYPFATQNDQYDAIIFDPIELQTVKAGGIGENYQDALLQDGFQQKHQLTIMGGSESVKYNFAANYFKQEGIMPDDIFNRMTMRTNLDFTLSPKITAGTSIQLNNSLSSQKSNPIALTQYAFNGNPLGHLLEADGVTPRFALTTDGFEINPMADYTFDSYRREQKGWNAFLNTYAEAKIIPGLTYRLSLGTNFKLATDKQSAGYYSITRNLGLPTAGIDNAVDNFKIYESTLTYDKVFGGDKHHLTVTAVHGFQSSRTEISGAAVSDLPYELSRFQNLGSANVVTGVNSNLSEWDLLSYVGRVFYGFKSKYLLTMTMRADGASQFAPGHKWGYFPSISGAYNISEEGFMKTTKDWLYNLKVRVGYGVTGNQAINPYQTQGSLARSTYSWNETAGFGYRPSALANRNLKWESTAATNIGIDFAFFKGRIAGNLDFYNTDTHDLLMYRKLPITSGFDQVLENIGSTGNKGYEIGLKTINVSKENFKWNTNFSYFLNDTKIKELYNGKVDDIGNGWFIGQPINVYYDYKKIGIWQTSEAAQAASYGRQPGQIKVLDLNNDGKISADDRMILGNRQPKFISNIANQFSYKNWDFAFTTYIRWGGMTSVGAFAPFSKKRYNKFIFDYWTPTNPTNEYPRPNQLYEGSGLDGSTLTYRDASLISIPQMSLGYSFSKRSLDKLHLSNARIYLSGQNMFYWTKSELRDFNMKADWNGNTQTYPAVRTFIAGINLGF